MFARVAYTMAAAAGLVVGAIAVLSDPATAVGWVATGVFVGAIVPLLRRQNTSDGDIAPTSGLGRHAGFRIGGAVCMAGLVLTGLGRLLGPAGGIVILTLLLLAAPLSWPWLR